LGDTAKWCSITFLGTPDKSDAFQAKTSKFAQRKATSAPSYAGERQVPMVKAGPQPLPSTDTFFVSARS
jgi:hypothetical protein